MANYPTSLDTLTNPSSGDPLNSPHHATQHSDTNVILTNAEAKLGTGGDIASGSPIGYVLTVSGSGVTQWRPPKYWGLYERKGTYSAIHMGDGTGPSLLPQDVIFVYPVVMAVRGTLDRLIVRTGAAGETGSIFHFGIYNNSTTQPYFPDSLLLDAGAVATDGAAGYKELTLNQSLDIGTYWVGGAAQSGTSGATYFNPVSTTWAFALGNAGTTTPGTTEYMGYYSNTQTGAFPSTFTQSGYFSIGPYIMLRWST